LTAHAENAWQGRLSGRFAAAPPSLQPAGKHCGESPPVSAEDAPMLQKRNNSSAMLAPVAHLVKTKRQLGIIELCWHLPFVNLRPLG
jgi:hypothetical protein